MTATEMAALIVAIASVVGVVLLAVALVSMGRTLREMRAAVELLRTELGDIARSTGAELDRVDGLLGRAESISGRLDSASRLAYLAFSNPVIKAAALASGTNKAAQSLRRARER